MGLVQFVIDEIRGIVRTFGLTLYYVFRGRWRWAPVLEQMFQVGNRSVFFILVTMGFLGAILNFQTGFQAMRLFGDTSLLGAATLPLLVRQLGPTLCGLMVAIRVGTGIAAEIGSMVVTEQTDALRMCAADPVDFLIKPRFFASVVMTTVLIIWSAAVAFTAGMATAYSFFDVAPRTFCNMSLIDKGDLIIGLSKCVAYGAAIPIVSGYCGLSTFGGSEGVGWATTRAVVNSSLAVIILNFFISGAGVFLFPLAKAGIRGRPETIEEGRDGRRRSPGVAGARGRPPAPRRRGRDGRWTGSPPPARPGRSPLRRRRTSATAGSPGPPRRQKDPRGRAGPGALPGGWGYSCPATSAEAPGRPRRNEASGSPPDRAAGPRRGCPQSTEDKARRGQR